MTAQPRSTKRILVIWDLDRTLFNTGEFLTDTLGALASLPQAHDHVTELSKAADSELFDPFGFLAQRGIGHNAFVQHLRGFVRRTHGPRHTYLYPDVRPAISHFRTVKGLTQVVLTTGAPETQRTKMNDCDDIADLPQSVTQENKGDVIERHFNSDGTFTWDGQIYDLVILFEDKSSTFDRIRQRASFRGFHVQRPDAKYKQKVRRPDVKEIPGLSNPRRLMLEAA